jgi:DNA (cytosine-5)-methyltransferase 1
LPDYPQPVTHPANGTGDFMLKATPTVIDAIGDIPDCDTFPELIETDTVRVRFGKPSSYAARLRNTRPDPNDFSYPREFDRGLLTSSLRSEHTRDSRRRFAKTLAGEIETISRFHKLDPAGVCNTIRAGTASDRGAFTSPRPIHPTLPRCITVREAARLHSYPDWFRFHVTKWHGFRQIGNSVPPLLARAVATKVREVVSDRRVRPATRQPLGDTRLLRLNMAEAATRYGVPKDTIAKRIRTFGVPLIAAT